MPRSSLVGTSRTVLPERPLEHPLEGMARWFADSGLPAEVRTLRCGDPEPAESDWLRADRVPEAVPGLVAGLADGLCQGNRTSAAAFLAFDFGLRVAGFAAVSALLAGRAPDLRADRVWLRIGPSGRPEGMALRLGPTALLSADTGTPGAHTGQEDRTLLADDTELDGWFMRRAVETIEPMLRAVRAETRFGTRPQWSMVADALHFALLLGAEKSGSDPYTAWRRAAHMVTAINHDAARVTPRQRPFPLTLATSPGETAERLFLVRGGCCFYYRYGARECVSCPLISDDDRADTLREYYEARA